ncbi:hypothetical protein NUSPORA_01744 [Nucleospora cyclopteri]
MIKKMFFVTYFVLCTRENDYIDLHKLNVQKLINDCLYQKTFLPEFYDFKPSLKVNNFLRHCENIIEKATNDNFFNILLEKFIEKKHIFVTEMTNIRINIFKISKGLQYKKDKISFYKKIESNFLEFYYNIINDILDVIINFTDKTEVYKKTIEYIRVIIRKFHKKKDNLTKFNKKKLKPDNDQVLYIDQMIKFLKNIKDIAERKFCVSNRLKTTLNLHFLKFRTTEKFDFAKNEHIKQNRYDLIIKNFIVFEDFLQKKINFISKDLDLEVYQIIEQLDNIVTNVCILNIFDLNIKHFVSLLNYFNYLTKKVILETFDYNIHSGDKYSMNKNKFMKCDKAFFLIKHKKAFIHTLNINSYVSKKFFCSIDSTYKTILIENNIVWNFVCIESVYDEFLYISIISPQIIQQKNAILNYVNQIKDFLEQNLNILVFSKNSILYFKKQCLFMYNLCSVYSLLKINTKKIMKHMIVMLIDKHIEKTRKFMNEIKKNSKNIDDINFLEKVIIKIEQYFYLFIDSKVPEIKSKNNEDIRNFFYRELICGINLYEIDDNSTILQNSSLENTSPTHVNANSFNKETTCIDKSKDPAFIKDNQIVLNQSKINHNLQFSQQMKQVKDNKEHLLETFDKNTLLEGYVKNSNITSDQLKTVLEIKNESTINISDICYVFDWDFSQKFLESINQTNTKKLINIVNKLDSNSNIISTLKKISDLKNNTLNTNPVNSQNFTETFKKSNDTYITKTGIKRRKIK